MKDLVRLKTSMSEEVEKILNEQVRIEATSSAKYLAMASWCEERGFLKSADFMYKQSEEERSHMLKIFKHINARGGKAISPEITNITYSFASLRDIFETSLEQEISVTNSINRIVDLARTNKDYATDKFFQWFIEEQMEEESVARRIIELFEIIGEDGQGLFLVDKEIGKVREESAA